MTLRTPSALQAVSSHFADSTVVSQYAAAVSRVGLWRSEALLFQKYFAPIDHLLDLGCGAGRIALGLYAKGYSNVQGCDLSTPMVSESQSIAAALEAPVDFRVEDACALSFKDGSFAGVIFGFNGLMQIPAHAKRKQALSEIRRVLRPSGIFIFTTHDRALAQYQAYWSEEAARWAQGTQHPALLDFGDRLCESPQGPYFIHIPSVDEVKADLAQAGFDLLFTAWRSEIALEPELVREFSDECRFWVAKLSGA